MSPDRDAGLDFRGYAFLGNIAEDIRVCFVRSALGFQSLADINKSDRPIIFAATAAGTSGDIDVAVMRNLFGMKIKQINGYQGSAAKRLAIENGEVDGDCAGFVEIPQNWLSDGKIKILVRMSPTLIAGLDSKFPYGGDVLTDPGARQIYDFLTAPERLGRIFMVVAKVPSEKKAMLRAGFAAKDQGSRLPCRGEEGESRGVADERRRGRPPCRRALQDVAGVAGKSARDHGGLTIARLERRERRRSTHFDSGVT